MSHTISIPKIRIRKIIHNSHCEYIGEFDCTDILYFFKIYTGLWFKEHTDSEGIITDDAITEYIDVSDDFNLLEEDYFIIGYPVTHMYEGKVVNSSSILIETPDEYGFELIKDDKGTKLTYNYANKIKI